MQVRGTQAGCCRLKQNIPRQRSVCSGSSSHAAVAHVMLLPSFAVPPSGCPQLWHAVPCCEQCQTCVASAGARTVTQQGDTGVPSVPKEPQAAEGMVVCMDVWAAEVAQLLSHALGCSFPTADSYPSQLLVWLCASLSEPDTALVLI